MPKTVKGQSYVKDWINAHVAYAGDDCLIWPFSKNWNGYGHVGAGGGKIVYAHRMMCSLAHGEPPTPKHQAAHSCNNGHGGCVNPRHITWKTNRENMFDRRAAGTITKRRWNRYGLVTIDQCAEIAALKGKMNQREIAARFGISPQHVSTIQLGRLRKQADAAEHSSHKRGENEQ